MVAREEEGGSGIDREFGVSRCKLFHLPFLGAGGPTPPEAHGSLHARG